MWTASSHQQGAIIVDPQQQSAILPQHQQVQALEQQQSTSAEIIATDAAINGTLIGGGLMTNAEEILFDEMSRLKRVLQNKTNYSMQNKLLYDFSEP